MKFVLKTRCFVDIYIATSHPDALSLSLTWHEEIQVQFFKLKQMFQ